MTEESEIKDDPKYRRWEDMDDVCTDDDSEDTNDDVDLDDDEDDIHSSGDSGMYSDRDNYDGSSDNNDDDDDDDDDYLLGENGEDVGDSFEDDVVKRFQSMDILGSKILLNGMHRGVERGWQHCPRVNWLKEPDLYREFDFNPPSGKAYKLSLKETD